MSSKLLRLRTARQRHFLPPPLLQLVPVLLLLPPSRPASAAAATAVTHLPGFDGPLPFNLETGYVGVEEETGAELFYYFVESERSPGTDPLLLWLTGGPRCSVIMGLAFEIGPLKFVLAPYSGGLPELVYNPYSWTKMANILLLDSPVGSGFSFARDPKGYYVGDYSSSSQVQTFLNKWFTDHPQYLSNPFYIGGDSYAGKVIPLIAQGISEGIDMRQQPVINLKGYMVGNPIADPKFDENYKIPSAHGFGIISDQIYESAVKNCKGDYVNPVNEMCVEVLHTINNGTTSEWIQCNIGLPYTYETPSSIPYHVNLTMKGYHALVYSGDHDLEAPFLGTQAWIRSLNFSIVADWRAWHLSGQAAGFTIEYTNNMTFATVKGAGHTAPEYRPKECFAMAQRWLDNEPL
ncbi:serine carboxypeptidase-like 18 isoform X1 [Triticum dicoccoides]|uniref:serine carboxypeptidase-like 18 isoform X1 n=1 Tax=Triticum dicoccoides TaxID=85692 RepID=UPI00189078C2|nr:serine carboxypeptidase-like 18 isoform X1 [Triticum dicoccoides]